MALPIQWNDSISNEIYGSAATVSTMNKMPRNTAHAPHAHTVPSGIHATAVTPVINPTAIATGMSGSMSTLTSGAISEKRPNVVRISGVVRIMADSVATMLERISNTSGSGLKTFSRYGERYTRPIVARNES